MTLIFLGLFMSVMSQNDGRQAKGSSRETLNPEPNLFQQNESEIGSEATEQGSMQTLGFRPANIRHANNCLERAEYSLEMNDYYATLVNANCLISRNVLLAEGYSYRGIAKYHLKDASFCIDLKIGCDYGNTGACEYYKNYCDKK